MGPTETVLMAGSRPGEILVAALAAFVEHGVAGTSIEEIRRRSGASVGSIYHHFPGGKQAVAGALYVEGLRDYQDGFVNALRGASSTRGGVEDAVTHHLTWVEEHADLARFIFLLGSGPGEDVAGGRELRGINRRFFTAVRAWMRPRVAAGELRDLPTEVGTALWIGPSQELARHWLGGRVTFPLTDAAGELSAAAWRSLSGHPREERQS
ncbi:TetR/AcrR family transcriptional regulator [Nocardia sp. NPDC127526]|uniref:TetR/AcrR family transcriptional regulator n=1 Tax=Nocardia sp. NPDC127526 TaxID=3345393 RepID=UPI00363E9102